MISHVFGRVDGANKGKSFDPIANAMFKLVAKDDSSVLYTFSGENQVILIAGT